MAIPVSGTSQDFTPAPAGTHQAVCVDVIDHGMVETQWGTKRKVTVRWQISETMASGKPFLVQKRYTASLNDKAVLRHDLEAWRGRPFAPEELNEFDLEKLLGVNALLNVVHAVKDAKTWANVASIAPLLKGMKPMLVNGYVRESLRKPEPDGDPEETRHDDEDRVPF